MSRGEESIELIGPASVGYPVPSELKQSTGTFKCTSCHQIEVFWRINNASISYHLVCSNSNCQKEADVVLPPRRGVVTIDSEKAWQMPGVYSCRFCHKARVIAPARFFWSTKFECCKEGASEIVGIPVFWEKQDFIDFYKLFSTAIARV
jgi:hypothetical protein